MEGDTFEFGILLITGANLADYETTRFTLTIRSLKLEYFASFEISHAAETIAPVTEVKRDEDNVIVNTGERSSRASTPSEIPRLRDKSASRTRTKHVPGLSPTIYEDELSNAFTTTVENRRTVHYVEQSTTAESTAAGSADGESQADHETGAHHLDKTDQDAALRIIQASKFNIGERDNFLEVDDSKNSRHLILYQVIALLLQTKEHGDEVTAVTMLIDLDTTNPIFKIIYAKNKSQLSEDDKSTARQLVNVIKTHATGTEAEFLTAIFTYSVRNLPLKFLSLVKQVGNIITPVC